MPKQGTWFPASLAVDSGQPSASILGRIAEILVWPATREKQGRRFPQTTTFPEQLNRTLVKMGRTNHGAILPVSLVWIRAKPNEIRVGDPDVERRMQGGPGYGLQ